MTDASSCGSGAYRPDLYASSAHQSPCCTPQGRPGNLMRSSPASSLSGMGSPPAVPPRARRASLKVSGPSAVQSRQVMGLLQGSHRPFVLACPRRVSLSGRARRPGRGAAESDRGLRPDPKPQLVPVRQRRQPEDVAGRVVGPDADLSRGHRHALAGPDHDRHARFSTITRAAGARQAVAMPWAIRLPCSPPA